MFITGSNRYKKIPIQNFWAKDVHGDGRFKPSYIPEFTNSEKFIEAKIEMLREQFCIELTDEDVEYLHGFNTEAQINAAVKTIINRHWKD